MRIHLCCELPEGFVVEGLVVNRLGKSRPSRFGHKDCEVLVVKGFSSRLGVQVSVLKSRC